MFQNSIFEGDISHWRINVDNARDMFTHAKNLSFLRWPAVYDGNHVIRSLEVHMGIAYQRVGHSVLQGLSCWSANQWQYMAVNDAILNKSVLKYVPSEYREFYNKQLPLLKDLNIPIFEWGDLLAQLWNTKHIQTLAHQDLLGIV